MIQLELDLYQKEFYDAIGKYFAEENTFDEFTVIVVQMK